MEVFKKGSMYFNTIFLTPYLLVVELKTKLVTFFAFNIYYPRAQRTF